VVYRCLFFSVFLLLQGCAAIPPRPASFALNEMDLHLHSGLERPVALEQWVDASVQGGRKVVILLDHLELYRKSPEEYAAWTREKGFPTWYPMGPAGHDALFADFRRMQARSDVLVYTGWEVSEEELDTGSEPDALRRAQVLGWHISPRNGREAPDGAHLIHRARQLLALQKTYPVPMILFHPFTMRLENLQRTAQRTGRPVEEIAVQEYRFFQPGEQEQLVDLLRGSEVYIEISWSTAKYWANPACREALIADILPLAKGGLQFTVSTDSHGLADIQKPFRPETYCAELGITPENTNGILRALARPDRPLPRVRRT
jgi:histidinol phosphatase-like PHP family hydrolase